MRSGKFGSACIIGVLATHYEMTKPTKEVSSMRSYDPTGGFALALAAVSNS